MNQVILKAAFLGAECSAKELGIQKCKNCEMSNLCMEMDKIYDAVEESTVVVKKTFNL
ncbi:hypothetical protein [uncultured Clostridium sp.]|uniref:hypothetical protein n=1 Tax=uncultured Clostridium sp. TaxID=59620 RepID=UPI0028EA83C8|nr:hypothetical protein [uncultured Clostridium sp.]